LNPLIDRALSLSFGLGGGWFGNRVCALNGTLPRSKAVYSRMGPEAIKIGARFCD
jgi:hypothetical protein